MDKSSFNDHDIDLGLSLLKIQMANSEFNMLPDQNYPLPSHDEIAKKAKMLSGVVTTDPKTDPKFLELIIKHQLEQCKQDMLVHPLNRIMNCKEPVSPITAELLNEALKRGPV